MRKGFGVRSPTAGLVAWLAALGGTTLAATPALAQEKLSDRPLSVTYGPAALPSEGDDDHREEIVISVPDGMTEPLYLRVFDPDVGGAHDLIYGKPDTEARYRLFGAPGGAPLAEKRFPPGSEEDARWVTIAAFASEDGERVDGRRVFRLIVDALAGDDANLFSVTVSLRDHRNMEPPGLAIVSFRPTVRMPDKRSVAELRFTVPADARSLTIGNFDAANGSVQFVSPFATQALAASGQGDWRSGEVLLTPEQRGTTAAILFGGGDEVPNDATFTITDDQGRPVPFQLPALARRPNQRPLPSAAVETLADCRSVSFDASASSDPDGDGLRYAWEFGDGAAGEGRTVLHQYPGPGAYSGTLRVADDSGAVDSGAALPFRVVLKRPPTAHAGPARRAAPGDRVAFDAAGSQAGDRPIARHLWSFGDGTQGKGVTATHVYAVPGLYTATLRVEDDTAPPCNAGIDTAVIDVNAPPVAVAGHDVRLAVGETVRLDGGSSYDIDGRITDYSWTFGDGQSAAGRMVEHAFDRPGSYSVSLAVRDDAGVSNSVARSSLRAIVNDPPVAQAGPDHRVAIGERIAFDASGSVDRDGALIAQAWDFGDGAQGSGPRVTYAYRAPGIYRVTLTVTDDSGTATATAEDEAIVTVNAPPVADAGPDRIVTSSSVTFDGGGSRDPDGRIARYDWDFGDGTTGSGRAPTHVYQKVGEYRVRLTVTDDSGTERNSASATTRIRVNAAPIADAGPDRIAAPGQPVQFSGAGSLDPDGDIVSYLWEFSDGSSASGKQVTHRFTEPGTYRTRLTVRDDTGQPDAVDFDEALVVVNAPPVADAGPDRRAAPGETVRLNGCNSFDPDGTLSRFRWTFGDTSAVAETCEATRNFAKPGTYSARLTVTDGSGALNGTAEDTVAIRINERPVASAGPDIVRGTTTVDFDGSASADADGDPLTYLWNFGDGSPTAGGPRVTHSYAQGGSYPVTLTVNDGTGLANATASATITATIDRPPVAVAGANRQACAGDTVLFDGSRSYDPDGGLLRYEWDFGDGTKSDAVNPTKVWRSGAAYPVTLTVHDESGFEKAEHTDRVVVVVDESPIAVAGPNQQVCANTEVRFDGSKSRDLDGVVNRFTWDFGDGNTGGGAGPVHVFRNPGNYRVRLTIEGDKAGQCDNTNTDELTVQVVAAPVAGVKAPHRAATGIPVPFQSATREGIAAHRWDFGDGATAAGAEVTHAYDRPGVYLATLSVQPAGEATACSAVTAQHRIVVNAPPVADAGPDRLVAVQEEITFDGSGSADPDGALTSYRWDFGDGTTGNGMVARHRYRASGAYTARLTVTDDAGVENSAAEAVAAVTVNAAPEPVITMAGKACFGRPLALSAAASRDADGPIGRPIGHFEWDFGDGTRAVGAEVEHSYADPGVYQLRLVADDGTGVANSRGAAAIALPVNRPPQAAAGPDRIACPGSPVAFDGSGSVDWDGKLIRHLWDFGDGSTAEGAKVRHSFAAPGQYDVRLSVTDDSGSPCAVAEDTALVRVNAPPVVEARTDREAFTGGAHDGVLFDASGSYDPEGAALEYVWTLGDGTVRTGEKFRHAYSRPGVYDVRLSVRDRTGLTCGQTETTLKVTVQDHATAAARSDRDTAQR